MSKPLYAVVDLGSNSFHMAVMQEDEGRIIVVDRLREMVQLGYGLLPDGTLDAKVRERALQCLRKFNERLANIPHSKIRAVGTLTMRKMKDPNFIRTAEDTLGVPIDIISGREEARLIYLGVSQYIHVDNEELFVIDIGGGSTEFVLGVGDTIQSSYSKEVGCVNITRRFFSEGVFTKQGVSDAAVFIESELHTLRSLMPYKDAHFVGASGTIKTINILTKYLGIQDDLVTLDAIKRLIRKIVSLKTTEKTASFFDIPEERARVICGGLIILKVIFRVLSVKTMVITDVAMREGMMFDLLGRVHKQDRRDETITNILKRFGTDEKQAKRVMKLSLDLAEMIDIDLIDESAHRYLKWASLLHEIGLAVSHHRHFKHSAYLIEHADLDGFSKQDQKILATILRNHQRKFQETEFEGLPLFVPLITLILRISVLLNRARYARELPDFSIQLKKDSVKLHFQKKWLKEHPLIAEDLKEEEKQLKRAGIKLRW